MSLPAELFPLLAQSAATDPKAARLLAMLAAVDAAAAERSHTTTEIPKTPTLERDRAQNLAAYRVRSEESASRPTYVL
jgi:hypothetical protein